MSLQPQFVPNDLYTISFYNHAGELYHVLRKWDRLEFSQRVNDPWNHSIQVRVSPDDPTGELLRSLMWDYFVVIERYDPISLEKDEVYAGIHQTSSEQTQTDGNIIFTLYGAGFSKFLDRRVVIPPPGYENSEKSGYAETVIKDYVYESMVAPTGLYIYTEEELTAMGNDETPLEVMQLSDPFVDSSRAFPGLSIVGTQDRGTYATYKARFTNLESVVKAVADAGGLDFGISKGDTLGTFVFDARPLWGTDRREDNTEGNKPAIFSLEYGNMLIPILSTNHRYEKNFVYVGGAGDGINRLIRKFENTPALTVSPWARSELFVDSREGETTEEVTVAGRAALAERGTKQAFDFDIRQTRASRWIRDWGLGDIITAYYRGRVLTKKIMEIQVVVSLGGQQREQITVELEDLIQYGSGAQDF